MLTSYERSQLEHKPCPVNRQRLISGLMCCSNMELLGDCGSCPYYNKARTCISHAANDALEYICYLEGQLNAKGT